MLYLSHSTQGTSLNQSIQFPSPLLNLLDDIWKLIFLQLTEMNFKNLWNCSLVDKKWKQMSNDPSLTKKMIYEGFCFNPSSWNKYCSPWAKIRGKETVSRDEIEKAYESLPNLIDKILKSDCPAFKDKRIIDSHMLVWIPEKIKGQPVTIENLEKLLEERIEFSEYGIRCCRDEIIKQERAKIIKSGWFLMTTHIIPDSRNQSYFEQKNRVENFEINGQKGYRIPKIAEAIVCIATEYFRTKKRLFPFGTFTRCEESVESVNDMWQSIVGYFDDYGFSISLNICDCDIVGIAALQRFPASISELNESIHAI